MVKFLKSERSESEGTLELSERSIAFRASTADDSAMTIDAVLSTEDPVGMFDYESWERIDEVLLASGRQATDYLPMLDSHQRWTVGEVLGHMSNIRTEKGNTVVTCNFDKNDEDSVRIFKKYRDGHARGLSVGYTVRKYVDIAPGATATVEGRKFTAGPVRKMRIATDWVAKEGSCVAVGADAKALSRTAAIGVRGLSVEMTEEQASMARAIHESRKKPNGATQERSSDGVIPESVAAEVAAVAETLTLIQGERLEAIAQQPTVVINITNDGVRTEQATPAPPAVPAIEPQERTAPTGATTDESTLDSVNQSVPAKSGGNQERVGTVMSTEKTAEETAADTAKVRADAIKEGIRMERERQDQIRELAGDDVSPECLDKCLKDADMSVEGARTAFLNDIRAQRKAASTPANSDSPKPLELSGNKRTAPSVEVVTAAMVLRCGGENAVKMLPYLRYNAHDKKLSMERSTRTLSEATRKEHERVVNDAYEYAQDACVDACRHALEIAQIESPRHASDIVTRSLSTPAVSTIYTQTMGAVLLANLAEEDDSTLGWCNEMDVDNFKNNELHRLEGAVLEKRNRGETARPASFADTMEQFKIAEYAKVLRIDEQDIIDDALNAWLSTMKEFARAIKSLRPDLVYGFLAANGALLTDSVALFHADHSNLITTSALAAATLQAALTKLSNQRGPGGLHLGLRKCALVTSTSLSYTADQLTTSVEIREAAAANGTSNVLRQRNIMTRNDGRLDTGFTYPATNTAVAAAATTWYLAAAGGDYGIQVGYLKGRNRMPQMKTSVFNGDGRYGLAMDVQHFIGVGVAGHQGLVKATA